MSNKKEENKIDEKTKRRNIAMSRRTSEMTNNRSASVSAVGSGQEGSASILSDSGKSKRSDVAKSNTGFKSVGTKSNSKAGNLKKKSSGLGPKSYGVNSNYSSHNNFGLK